MQPVAWPIRPDYAAGISYYIYEAEKKYGLDVESLKEEYDARTEQPMCDVKFSLEESESDDYTKISLFNLFFPFLFWGIFAIAAFGLQLYVFRLKKKNKNKCGNRSNNSRPSGLTTMVGRNSSLCLTQSLKPGVVAKDNPDLASLQREFATLNGGDGLLDQSTSDRSGLEIKLHNVQKLRPLSTMEDQSTDVPYGLEMNNDLYLEDTSYHTADDDNGMR